MQQRQYKYDTMRCLLIFLVVFCHFLEKQQSTAAIYLYKTVYVFHMPAFFYLSGKFAKAPDKRFWKHLALPYLVFQILYLCFDAWVLKGTALTLQFTTPYWIMWYLLALIVFCLLIPVLPEKGSAGGWIALGISVAIALLAGFDNTTGYYASLSRIAVLAPFFLWGRYSEALPKVPKWLCITAGACIIAVGTYYVLHNNVPNLLLYNSASYKNAGSTVTARLLVMVTAAGWIVFLENILPRRSIPGVCLCGQNTLPVYLLHGFAVRLAEKYEIFTYSHGFNIGFACFIALTLVIVLGNPWLGKAFKKLF